MNHSHCLYLTLACDEYSREWAVLLTGLFSSSKLTFSFDMSALFCIRYRSMLPDVVDDFAMRHPSCKDLEPLFFSCYAFCSKLAGGLAVGISTMTLQWVNILFTCYVCTSVRPSHFGFLPVCRFVGYRAGACTHGEGVVTALTVLFSPVPIALLLIGMVFFRSYPINERRSLQLQAQLTTVQ